MRDVRKIGRRTWLARASGGAGGLDEPELSGCGGWAVSIWMQRGSVDPSRAGGLAFVLDLRRVQLGRERLRPRYVVIRGREATIVDTGVGGSGQRIGEVSRRRAGWDAVRNVIVTHHHGDHAGSVGAILGEATQATVWAGAADIPRITSPRQTRWPRTARRSSAAGDRDAGPHPRYISLYDETASTFISGDAINTNGGPLRVSPPQNPADRRRPSRR